jgi:hypothetical protein
MSAGELAPSFGIVEATWEENEDQASAFSNNGQGGVLELGDPFWTIDVKVTIISRDHFDQWDAFLARRRLQGFTFTMWRSLRVRPRDAGIVSDGALVLSGINVAASQLTLSGYGAGRNAHIGDMISYRTLDNGYWVGKVVAPATADGFGQVTVDVWPRPWAAHASAPLPRRIQALGEFRLTGKPRKTEGYNNWRIQFEAEQVLR